MNKQKKAQAPFQPPRPKRGKKKKKSEDEALIKFLKDRMVKRQTKRVKEIKKKRIENHAERLKPDIAAQARKKVKELGLVKKIRERGPQILFEFASEKEKVDETTGKRIIKINGNYLALNV